MASSCFLVAEIVRYTGDLDLARQLCPRCSAPRNHIDALAARAAPTSGAPRRMRTSTDSCAVDQPRGLLGQAHALVLDDFFALRGLTDAAWLAGAWAMRRVGRAWPGVREHFAADFAASIVARRRCTGSTTCPAAPT